MWKATFVTGLKFVSYDTIDMPTDLIAKKHILVIILFNMFELSHNFKQCNKPVEDWSCDDSYLYIVESLQQKIS